MGKGASNLTSEAQSAQIADSASLVQLAQGQAANANQLFQASMPGFNTAESFYSALAGGDPYAIARTLAPQAQQISTASAGARQNILQNGPAGGEKNLALEQVNVNQGAQVGSTASQAFLNAPNALASLAGQGVGESQSAAGLGISGLSSANTGYGNVAQQSIQQKGNSLGAFSSLGSDAATVGGAALGAGGWGALFSK